MEKRNNNSGTQNPRSGPVAGRVQMKRAKHAPAIFYTPWISSSASPVLLDIHGEEQETAPKSDVARSSRHGLGVRLGCMLRNSGSHINPFKEDWNKASVQIERKKKKRETRDHDPSERNKTKEEEDINAKYEIR